MYAEEYLVDRIKKLEDENDFLKRQNEIKEKRLNKQNDFEERIKELEEQVHFHRGKEYMFRGMSEAFLKASTITFVESESEPLVHIELGNFKEIWSGPGAEWVKDYCSKKEEQEK